MNDEFRRKSEELKEIFPYATDMVPFYAIGRILMPGYKLPALAVPLDGDYVVPTNLNRMPYGWLNDLMGREQSRYLKFAESMKNYSDFSDVLDSDKDGLTPYLPNGYFSYGDAIALTTMLATHNPNNYIEIGSGNSTRFARRSINKYQLNTKITCIDPNPRASVKEISDEWISESVVNIDPEYFNCLQPGDVLMLDGSHLVFHGTDTTHLFLRVMPILKPGIFIHVHDIHLPHEYPEPCDRLFWNEQYMLAMLFLNKPISDIIAPIKYMSNMEMCPEGASFWFKT